MQSPNRPLLPTDEQLAKKPFIPHGKGLRVKYVTNLEKYLDKKIITPEQYYAGTELYKDAYLGGILGGTNSTDYSKVRVDYTSFLNQEIGYFQADKRRAFGDAIHAPDIGASGRRILWDIVVFNYSLSETGLNKYYAKHLLVDALQNLCDYYRAKGLLNSH